VTRLTGWILALGPELWLDLEDDVYVFIACRLVGPEEVVVAEMWNECRCTL